MAPTAKHDDFTPSLKAIYLMSIHAQHIDCDDVRLIVRAERSAPRPMPLSRIERIVSGHNAQWNGRAIAACLLRDIPIIWLDERNQPVGDAHPLHREGGPLHHDIQHYLDLPDSMTRYANWLKSQRMDSVRHVRAPGVSGWWDGERLKREYVYKNSPASRPGHAVRAACQSVVNRRLATLHARTRYWGEDGQPLEIARDMAELIAMEYHIGHPEPTNRQNEQVKQFEEWRKEGRGRFEHVLNDFQKHIRNEIESCP